MTQPSTAVIHFYRASVAHADVWRQRLDTTTNWAVVTNAGVLSFVLSSGATPHFVLLLLMLIDLFFLVMESRRYQIYDIWHSRLHLMHRYVFAEALSGEKRMSDETIQAKLTELARDLGHTVPRMSLVDAIGFRIRRNYFYIFMIAVGAWIMKLDLHPHPPASFLELVSRARVGPVGGSTIFAVLIVVTISALILAVRAPSERIIDWSEQPSPLRRMLPTRLFWRPPTTDEVETHPERFREERDRHGNRTGEEADDPVDDDEPPA